MKMLNQNSMEAALSAKYVSNYMDYIENLPIDAQRHCSRVRDIDVFVRNHIREIEKFYVQWAALERSTIESDIQKRKKCMSKIQKSCINIQELEDEKMSIVNQLQELVEQKTKQMDLDYSNLNYSQEDIQMTDVNTNSGGSNNPSIGNQSNINTSANNQQANSTKSQNNARVPSPVVNSTANIKSDNLLTYNLNINTTQQQIQSTNTSSVQRVSTPTASANERCLSGATSTQSSSNDPQRAGTKRSRRPRNDANIDLGGNESNSANESVTVQKQSTQISSNSVITNQQNNKKAGGGQGGQNANNSGKKKKRKTRGQGQQSRDQREETPPPDPIDPDEPTYCLCDQISFGEMILCDNDLCPIEWFHFSCVTLTTKPKGKWFCPNCRGDRPNVMKPKAQFLKELERYNKEKEEKT